MMLTFSKIRSVTLKESQEFGAEGCDIIQKGPKRPKYKDIKRSLNLSFPFFQNSKHIVEIVEMSDNIIPKLTSHNDFRYIKMF